MQTAVASVSLPGPLDEKLAAIAAAGFRGVEIFENDLLSFNGTPAEVTNRFHRFLRGKGVMMPAGENASGCELCWRLKGCAGGSSDRQRAA
jgi:hypothetical protein